MIDRIDEMSNVMQQGRHFEQEQITVVQLMQRFGLFKKTRKTNLKNALTS